ncbi:hypothetical protein GW17_00036753 [Ensete ventricosum]|nr:hypothetical protein GW17_00036753 [Ensete ventricosum]
MRQRLVFLRGRAKRRLVFQLRDEVPLSTRGRGKKEEVKEKRYLEPSLPMRRRRSRRSHVVATHGSPVSRRRHRRPRRHCLDDRDKGGEKEEDVNEKSGGG